MSEYFSEPYDHFVGNFEVELSYATKADLKKQQDLIHLN